MSQTPTHPTDALGESSIWLQQTLKDSRTALYEWDVAQGRITWSDNASELLGVNGTDISNTDIFSSLIIASDAVHIADARIKATDEDSSSYSLHYELKLPAGKRIPVHESGHQLRDENGVVTRLVGMITPDTAQLAAETENSEDTYNYSRPFMRTLEKCLKETKQSDFPTGALITICINNMAMIVSGYGHAEAEGICSELRAEMQAMLDPQDTLFRIQRDQFAIITPHRDSPAQVTLMKKLNMMLKQYGGTKCDKPLHVIPTLACTDFKDTIADQPYCTAITVVDKAYVDMYAASSTSIQTVDMMDGSPQSSLHQMEMANYLHDAIHNDRLRLAYQPIIRSSDGKAAHYECLLRLVGDDGSVTSAGALIPVAERMGLIDVIDQLVLEMVVEDLMRCPDVHLAFNVSNLTTTDHDWLDTLNKVVGATPEIAPRMCVEITETAAQRNLSETAYFVAAIQSLGCKVALDDFGSGYTSFRQLKTLSCDMIKIDGQFVRDLEVNNDNRFFVKTLLDFVQGFGLEAIAECVETGEAAKILMDLGVHYMQGYYFGRPETHRTWLREGEYLAEKKE